MGIVETLEIDACEHVNMNMLCMNLAQIGMNWIKSADFIEIEPKNCI